MKQHPPKWINSTLLRIYKNELREEIAGDLLEFYDIWVEKHGVRKAKFLYIWHAIKFFRWYAIKKPTLKNSNNLNMYSSYFKIARRNLAKHKAFAFINIAGLSIGLACCLMISIYVKDELSYDRFHENADKIYRITRDFKSPDGSTTLHLARLSPPFLPLLKEDFPEMETLTRFCSQGGVFRVKEKLFNEELVGWADPDFFKVFTFDFISGNQETALSDPSSMVLAESIAMKYFGTTDALGKTVSYQEKDFQVTGVVKDMPENSHFHLEIIGSFAYAENFYGGAEAMKSAWGENNLSNYFILKDGASVAQIESRFPAFLSTHFVEDAPEWTGLHVQKMTDIHLHSDLELELSVNSDISYVYTLSGIALLILIIAMINYMNLTTAKSANRAKEVGVRKTIGAGKQNLVSQFLIESVVLVEIAAIAAVVLVQFLLPFLRTFTEKSLSFTNQEGIMAILIVLSLGLIIGIMAGAYPAFYLSSLKTLKVLNGRISGGVKTPMLRRSLVIVQFTISATLIAITAIIFQQIEFIQNKKLGYEKDHVITTFVDKEVRENYEPFKRALLEHSSIKSIARSRVVPTDQLLSYSGARVELKGEMVKPSVNILNLRVDHEFLDTYGIKIKAGRNFDENIISDKTQAFILNEAAVKMIGWESNEDAIGRQVEYHVYVNELGGHLKGKVIGVIEDVHFESLKNQITPQIMFVHGSKNKMSIKFSGDNVFETMSLIEETWAGYFPNTPIYYNFIDDRFENLYQAESRRATLFACFSLLAILLACLGLFGLASFIVVQRSKEISIRKVLGATVFNISSILTKEFILMVGVSVLLGFPIAFLAMNSWLENYAYRISIGYLPFLLAAVLSIFIAVSTIGLQIYQAATKNPVKYLKNDG